MRPFGLHLIDVAIIVGYILIMIWIGKRVSRGIRDSTDFYLAGRRLGKFYQFFLNFGSITSADQTVTVTREIYRQGIGGMWIQYLVLFLTPFYWFTALFFRRVRLITVADYFAERFESKGLAASYALFTLMMAMIGGAASYMVVGKTMMALTPKPPSAYTAEERRSVEEFREYMELRKLMQRGALPVEKQARFEQLDNKYKRGELKAFISYLHPVVIYTTYGVIVCIYTILGGFFAAAITDAIQGILIITFSLILIPFGLYMIGGFAGLHARVPDYMFELFGSATTSEYAWYTVAAMVLSNLVAIVAGAGGMALSGSAKDEMTARFGILSGSFFKRFIMIFWALAGLIAVALYAGKIHDPDLIWGYMTRDLLGPGFIGIMLAGILAANMSTLDAQALAHSALFIRNLYQPLLPNRPEGHYITIGRIVVAITILSGIGVALFVGNLLTLYKYFISIGAIFGASIWLGFIWRRLTRWAVILQVIICFIIMAIIPNLFVAIPAIRTYEPFLKETNPQVVTIKTGALEEDVAAGRAEYVGQIIEKEYVIPPSGIFFERVVRQDPSDPNSPKEGLERFRAEVWILSLLGIDFSNASKATLVACRFLFDALFPFVLLFLFSYLTPPNRREVLDRFYAKMHTPARSTREEDRKAVERSFANPRQFESRKIWPGSNWEILKPTKWDFIGFFGSWIMVGIVLLCLYLVLHIQ